LLAIGVGEKIEVQSYPSAAVCTDLLASPKLPIGLK